MVFLQEKAEERKPNVPRSEVRLTFEKSGYMHGEYIPKLRDADLEKRCIRALGEYIRRLQCVFATDSFAFVGKRRNIFVLVSSVERKRWSLSC